MTKIIHIGIDVRLAGDRHAGIGRYTQNLVNQLLLQAPKNYFFSFFFYSQEQADNVLANAKQISQDNYKVIIAPISHYSLKEQLKLPKIFNKEKLDLLHVPHFNIPLMYQKKLVVTIHDLLWHEYKGGEATTLSPLKYNLKYCFYRLIVKQAVTKAQQIIVPAQTIKQTITKYYPKVVNKITVTTEGGRLIKTSTSKDKIKKLKNTLLFVGSLYPHKNIKLVLKALKQLPKFQLLIVGSRSIFTEQTKELAKNIAVDNQVKFLGYLTDTELTRKYQQVTALVQPSFSEGFGLTGIEAMLLNTPVLASSIPIFREIYQDSVYYFSPHSELSFINALNQLPSDPQQTEKLQQAKKLASSYSWKKMTQKTLAVYQTVLSTK